MTIPELLMTRIEDKVIGSMSILTYWFKYDGSFYRADEFKLRLLTRAMKGGPYAPKL